MEMCYDGALVMPSSYAVMNEEEMTYVEGGGTTFTLNKSKCAQIATYIYGAGFGVTAALALGKVRAALYAAGGKVVNFIRAVCSTAWGIVGAVVSSIIAGLALSNIVTFAVNVVTADRKDKGCSMTWYGAYFGNFKLK